MRVSSLLVAVSLISISGALADPAATTTNTTPSAVPTQPAADANDPNRMVCRSKAAKLGSRLGATRECRTQREWDDIAAQDRREIQKMQSTGMTGSGH